MRYLDADLRLLPSASSGLLGHVFLVDTSLGFRGMSYRACSPGKAEIKTAQNLSSGGLSQPGVAGVELGAETVAPGLCPHLQHTHLLGLGFLLRSRVLKKVLGMAYAKLNHIRHLSLPSNTASIIYKDLPTLYKTVEIRSHKKSVNNAVCSDGCN